MYTDTPNIQAVLAVVRARGTFLLDSDSCHPPSTSLNASCQPRCWVQHYKVDSCSPPYAYSDCFWPSALQPWRRAAACMCPPLARVAQRQNQSYPSRPLRILCQNLASPSAAAAAFASASGAGPSTDLLARRAEVEEDLPRAVEEECLEPNDPMKIDAN